MGVGALIGAAIGAIFGGGAVIFGVTLTVWQAIAIGASLGSLFDKPDLPSVGQTSANYSFAPLSNTKTSILPVPVVYGKCRVGGNIFMHRRVSDSVMEMFVGLSEGPICGIEDVRANDENANAYDGTFFQEYLGTFPQVPNEKDPDGVGYPGTAYFVNRLTANEKISGNPVLSTIVYGRRLPVPNRTIEDHVYIDVNAAHTRSGTSDSLIGYRDTNCTSAYYMTDSSGQLIMTSDAFGVTDKPIVAVIALGVRLENVTETTVGVKIGGVDTGIRIQVNSLLTEDFKRLFTAWDANEKYAVHWHPRVTKNNAYDNLYVYGLLYVRIPASDVTSETGTVDIGLFFPNAPDGDAYILQTFYGDETSYETTQGTLWEGFDTMQYFSANPAWAVRDLLTHTRYGLGKWGITDDMLDLDSFQEAADFCDAMGYTLNLMLDDSKRAVDWLPDVLGVFGGYLLPEDKIRLRYDWIEDSPYKAVTPSQIVKGSFSYWKAANDEIPNRVVVEFVNEENHWERDYVVSQDETDIASRGVVEIKRTLLGVTNQAHAEKLASYIFNASWFCRNFCVFQVGLQDADVGVGDVVAVTHPLPGWRGKWMRVVKTRDVENNLTELTCIEYDARVYNI